MPSTDCRVLDVGGHLLVLKSARLQSGPPHMQVVGCLSKKTQEHLLRVCVFHDARVPKSGMLGYTPRHLPNKDEHEVNTRRAFPDLEIFFDGDLASSMERALVCVYSSERVCVWRGWCWHAGLHPILGLDHLGLLTGCYAIPEAC